LSSSFPGAKFRRDSISERGDAAGENLPHEMEANVACYNERAADMSARVMREVVENWSLKTRTSSLKIRQFVVSRQITQDLLRTSTLF
jgi:hypothetical protein